MSAALQALPDALYDRQKHIGSSDIAAILGISPWASAVDCWMKKTQPVAEDNRNAKAKARGSRLEPYIRDMIEHEYDIQIEAWNNRYVDPEIPVFVSEIDAETREQVNIEIKAVHPFAAKDWGEQDTDELPMHYVAQVQWALGVTRRQHALVFALIGDDLRQYRVERDLELIAAMRHRALLFWNDNVLPKVPPRLDYSDPVRTVETLKKLYPGTNGVLLQATESQIHWKHVLEESQVMHTNYERAIESAKAHLLAEMGPAAAIHFPDGMAFERKKVTRKGFTVEPSTFMQSRFTKIKEAK